MGRSRLGWMGVGVVLTLFWSSPVAARCLEGTSIAAYQYAGPFRGFYLYTIELHFVLEKGLSNVSLKLNVEDCPELACQQLFYFPDPAGTLSDAETLCPRAFIGEYNCKGNPSIDLVGPVVKWDAVSSGGCVPGKTGTVTLYFYTNIGPDPDSRMPFFLIKNGLLVCEGHLVGDTPGPACMVPVDGTSWGAIKAIYE
jgi:hypothetical protein